MNVIDIIIILFILLGGVAGFKAGVLKKIVSFVGLFIVVIVFIIVYNNCIIFDSFNYFRNYF